MRTAIIASLFTLLFVACTAVDHTETVQVPVVPTPIGTEVPSNAGNYSVIYNARPASIPSGELFGLSVWILDADSREVAEDVALVVDASMPQHQHGMNVLPSHSVDEHGEHRVEGLLFHMPGAWTVTFDLEREGITERAEVVIDVN
ncbi:MAG: hypothetical protein ACI8TQ_002811 [Planctomycetota bacterium]|jgi:hypothetical protein